MSAKSRVIAALMLLALLAAPFLLDAYRLDRYIRSSAQAQEANGGAWPRMSDACTGCHSIDGHSANQAYPSLAAQRPEYLSQQLRRFARGERHSPIMNAMARSLTEQDIAALAAHFGRQPARGNAHFRPDPSLLEKGRQLVAGGGCAACHGEGLMGSGPFPRLAGLGHDYLIRELRGFSDGSRRDPSQAMNTLAAAWSPQERSAIAVFLAGHPVTPQPLSPPQARQP